MMLATDDWLCRHTGPIADLLKYLGPPWVRYGAQRSRLDTQNNANLQQFFQEPTHFTEIKQYLVQWGRK